MKAVEAMQEFNRLASDRYRLYDINDRLNPIDIQGYLNKGIDRMLVQKFLSYNTPYENVLALQQSYDEISDLVTIDDSVSVTDATGAFGNYTQKIDSLADDYLYYVFSSCKVSRDKIASTNQEWVGNKEINYSSLLGAISGSHNYPIIRTPLVYFNEDSIYIIHDAYTTINDVNLGYLRYPERIDMSADNEIDLPEHWHMNLVEIAVGIYIEENKFRYVNKEGE